LIAGRKTAAAELTIRLQVKPGGEAGKFNILTGKREILNIIRLTNREFSH